MARRAGILIPLFSLRGRGWGLGEIPDLVPMARWAAAAGHSVIQLLPVNEASHGQNSPYAALTAFGLDPVYLALESVEDFQAAGGISALSPTDRETLERLREQPAVDWQAIRAVKGRAVEIAFQQFRDREVRTASPRFRELERYQAEHQAWLEPYALFSALHDQRGGRSWLDWEAPLRDRNPGALEVARRELSDRILYRSYLQWQLDRQWREARRQANALGVELMGDLPFMVAGDSADVWSRSGEFRLDARVGVPPDDFSDEGQDWGLPVFRWELMEAGGFTWMRERARRNAELFGLYRVDHVVGLYRTYYRQEGGEPGFTPADQPAQIALGEAVIRILSRGAQVIAEDLGVVPDFVRASLTRLGVPGYRVLRWEKDGATHRDPAGWPALSVATTGTHDTESLADWFEALDADGSRSLIELPGLEPLRERAPDRFDDGVRDALLQLVYRSGSDLALLPFQDALGSRERVNVPGTIDDANWTYRMAMPIAVLAGDGATTGRLRSLAEGSGRLRT
jgi:4-alpha-glucanotransferase